MSTHAKPGKTKVELNSGAARPSKIRRDPPPPQAAKQTVVTAADAEREVWTVIIGVLLFGIAITIIILAASDYTAG